MVFTSDRIKPNNVALVIGGGVAGVQAALDMADCGVKVHLIEMSPAIGGKMAQLDKTFPTNDCAMCILAPKLAQAARHRNIELHTNSRLIDLSGDPGDFKAKVKASPRYVDISKCTGCGDCASVCPAVVADSFDEGLGQRKAIYIPYPQAVPRAYAIDMNHCKRCGACAKKCGPKAINLDDVEETLDLKADAVIISSGFRLFDPSVKEEFGFGRYKNVLTRMQFERMLSASGPTGGEIVRPSDSAHPEKVAFLQCVGSRDKEHNYCSSFCCMFATKEAILVKEHQPEAKAKIFLSDMRAFGKGFEAYYQRAKDNYGVEYVRCRVSGLKEDPITKGLIIKYVTGDGEVIEEEFDMVTLSVGGEPSKSITELSLRWGIELDEHGFCKTEKFAPLRTSRDGVYVCGSFIEPMDIPDSVIQASGAAAEAMSRMTLEEKVESGDYPVERDISSEPAKIGVFVCHCGSNIAGVVDVKSVAARAKELPFVVHSENLLYACSEDSLKVIKDRIEGLSLNRVVVASCTPRTHEGLFQETLRESKLNPFLFEMANIRDQCSWVHSKEAEKATEKAFELVRMAVARAAKLKPLAKVSSPIKRRALVVGGGAAGMTAALGLAEQGIAVDLVEKEAELGGNLRFIRYTLEGADPKAYLGELIERTKGNDLIKVHLNSKPIKSSGFVGNFVTEIMTPTGQESIEHGAAIMAIGARAYDGDEYLRGSSEKVVNQFELEAIIADSPELLKGEPSVVMIQCVGPKERSYCSRLCCSTAVKNALKIKEINPRANVFVLYKDMRTFGTREAYYTEARRKGVVFIRYSDDNPPKVQLEGDGIVVMTFDPILKREINIAADLIALSTATVPHADMALISSIFKLPLSEDGFFLEAHIKLRPVDFASEGFYLCGLAHYPKFIEESLAQAQAAVARSLGILKKDELKLGGMVARVDKDRCMACLTCVRGCPYLAPAVGADGKVEIAAARCQGCGTCVAECPGRAITLGHYGDDQIMAALNALFEREVV
ncbi:MAG: FAD-dependent oxidoreductase [Actinomycetota bacterium]|nr:FAD-dependent oxidoreductase [Actinomycetota bacterium]